MGEKRQETYLNLINQLLSCPNGQESGILSTNQDLIDAGLVQIMWQVAEELLNRGDQNAADFLINIARYLAETLELSSPTTFSPLSNPNSQQDFLLQILQLIPDSNGNPQVVYPWLQANLDLLNENFAQVFRDWTIAKLSDIESKRVQFAAIISLFCNLIRDFPIGNRARNLEIAITGYEVVGTVFTRDAFPEYWALTQKNLGDAYFYRLRGDRAQNIERAIEAYKTALQVRTREAFPKQWAMLQNNLGITYSNRIQGNRAQNLEDGIEAFLFALEICTREVFSEQWAQTQNNLGNAYCYRIRGNRAENLEKAIEAYEAALLVRTREAFPEEWASTQSNLGEAYRQRIRGERASNLEKAIEAYKAALQICTREAVPEKWAGIQNNLGIVYSNRIQGNRAQNLEDAIKAYEAALQIYTRESFPEQWAQTLNNLAAAYSDRIRGERADNLENAIQLYEAVLQVRTRESFPEQWAQTLNNLAAAYSDRIRGERAENLEKAIEACNRALQIYTHESFPEQWAQTQNSLGTAYSQRIQGSRAENLEKAIEACNRALQVYTHESFPQDWAGSQNNLGAAYLFRIRGIRSQNLEDAIQALLAALQVYTREAFPEQWALSQNNLGIAYSDRIQGERAENLEKAIEAYKAALLVRTREAFPENWATIQHNLGVAYLSRIQGDRAQNLEDAIRALLAALQVYTCEAFPEDWAMVQNSLGAAYSARIRGDRAQNLEDAIQACNSALQVYTRDAFPEQWAMSQHTLGNAYRERVRGNLVENLENAIEAYKAALQVRTREAFPEEWAAAQIGLGNAYCNKKWGNFAENLEKAIKAYKSALQVYTHEAFPKDWAMTQSNLGNGYSNRIQGDPAQNLEDAIQAYEAALLVRTREAFPEDWATTQNNLGASYSKRIRGDRVQNLKKAICCYQNSLEIRTRDAFPQKYPETLSNLGFAYNKNRQQHLAHDSFAAAIDTVEALRGEIVSGDEAKQKLAEQWNILYQGMVEVCLELGNLTYAIEYAERSKTRNLIELILNRDLHSIFPVEVVSQLEKLRDQIASGQSQLQTATSNDPATLAQHLAQLRQQRNNLQDRHLPIGSGFKFDEFRKTLDNSTVIVEFYITDEKLFTFIFSSQTQQPIFLKSEAKDLKKLKNWVNGYLKAYYNHKSHWQRRLGTRLNLLAKILHIDEIIANIPSKYNKLILIPHRYLHLFPLHALPLTGNSNLFERFPQGVHYTPSCQLLQLAQKRERPDFTDLFAIQNPTEDLAYTDIEVEIIKRYFEQTNVLKKTNATKLAITDNNLNTFHCNHFSCHGYFNLSNPQKSLLILADAHLQSVPAKTDSENYLILQDGRVIDVNKCLTLDAIFNLNLEQCRLVTLSACETGLTDFRNSSDEYIGLPSGFLYAGSPSVLSSLWTVSDLSTAFLMAKFYENLQKQTSVALCLNQAQLWLRNITGSELWQWIQEKHLPLSPAQKMHFRRIPANHRPFQDPFHWAAFCAIGES